MNGSIKRLLLTIALLGVFQQAAAALDPPTEFVYGPSGGYNDAHVVFVGIIEGKLTWTDADLDNEGSVHIWVQRPGDTDSDAIVFDSKTVPGRQLRLTRNEYWLKEPSDSGFVRKYFGRWQNDR